MKRVSVFISVVFSFLVLFSACELTNGLMSDDALIEKIATSISKEEVKVTNLPTEISQTIKEGYFETYIYEAKYVSKKGYELELGSGDLLYFNTNNKQLEGDYKYTVCGKKHKKNKHGNKDEHQGENKEGHGKHKGEIIDIEDLPEAIFAYVEENYPEAEIEKAKIHEDFYFVKITGPVVLKFDDTGSFIEELIFNKHHCQGKLIKIDELPDNILNYVSETYPEAELKHALLHPERYSVGILNNDTKIALIFDLDGNFLFERVH